MGEVVTAVQYSRSSPARAMEALRHEHEYGLVEVKGIAVWILNVLVDATRHHGETETADQNSSLVDLHSRKGKGRAVNGNRPVGAPSCRREQQVHGDLPNPPPPAPRTPPPHERLGQIFFQAFGQSKTLSGAFAANQFTPKIFLGPLGGGRERGMEPTPPLKGALGGGVTIRACELSWGPSRPRVSLWWCHDDGRCCLQEEEEDQEDQEDQDEAEGSAAKPWSRDPKRRHVLEEEDSVSTILSEFDLDLDLESLPSQEGDEVCLSIRVCRCPAITGAPVSSPPRHAFFYDLRFKCSGGLGWRMKRCVWSKACNSPHLGQDARLLDELHLLV